MTSPMGPEIQSTSTGRPHWRGCLGSRSVHDDLRFGAWGEVRTTSDAVLGGELSSRVATASVQEPHRRVREHRASRGRQLAHVTVRLALAMSARIRFTIRGFEWARHAVGGRVVFSMNRSIEDPREWSATMGLEVEPIGAVRALLDAF